MMKMTLDEKTLQALVIDRHFGELSAEAATLLAHYLEQNAEARLEAGRLVETLGVMARAGVPVIGDAVVFEEVKTEPVRRGQGMAWLARAAGFVLLAGIVGFVTGRSMMDKSPEEAAMVEVVEAAAPLRAEGHWARYRLEVDPLDGGMQVVRVSGRLKREEEMP